MSYAMVNLRWKFYLINASWNILFFAIIYLTWVETARVPLEEVALKFGDLDEQYIAEGDLSHYQSRPESLELVGSSTLPKSTAQ